MGNQFTWDSYRDIPLINDVFIETGTGWMGSLNRAVEKPFKLIYSCDTYEKYVIDARNKFANDPRVHVYHGHSPEVLQDMINEDRATTFWLDAHFMLGNRVEQYKDIECPLIPELETIWSYSWDTLPIIVIDDADAFIPGRLPGGFDKDKWPNINNIEEMFPAGRYEFSIWDLALWCMPRTRGI